MANEIISERLDVLISQGLSRFLRSYYASWNWGEADLERLESEGATERAMRRMRAEVQRRTSLSEREVLRFCGVLVQVLDTGEDFDDVQGCIRALENDDLTERHIKWVRGYPDKIRRVLVAIVAELLTDAEGKYAAEPTDA